MSRLIIRWTDQHERPHDWPFVTLGREVASVEVDGVEYANVVRCRDCESYQPGMYKHFTCEYLHKWAKPDGFCAWGEKAEELFATCKCGEDIECEGSDTAVCPSCGRVVVR